MNRILVVDDERQITRFLRASLQASGFQVDTASDGFEALEKIAAEKPDLLITDLAMPGMDGVQLTRLARRQSNVPIIVLSVRDAEKMKVEALESGADDYVTKPFSMPELLARVRAHLRRTLSSTPSEGPLEVGHFVLDEPAHAARLNGVSLALTPKEFDLLKVFMQKPERVLTHKVLSRGVWGQDFGDHVENLRVLIASLRKKLERVSSSRYIESEPWVGYRFLPGGEPAPEQAGSLTDS